MIGTISRWGPKGYGFVTSPDLGSEAWVHAKFLDDPDYCPRVGDEVEFRPWTLPDGRRQARDVRLARPANGKPPRRPAANVRIETIAVLKADGLFDEDGGPRTERAGNLDWCHDNLDLEHLHMEGCFMFHVADYAAGWSSHLEPESMREAGCTEAFVEALHRAIALGTTYVAVEAGE